RAATEPSASDPESWKPAALVGLGVGLVVLLVVAGKLLWERHRRARLEAFRGRYAFVDLESEDLEGLDLDLRALFGPGSKVAEAQQCELKGLTFILVSLLTPEYRVEEDGTWDDAVQEGMRKTVLVVRGFPGDLPLFRLLPNSWMLRAMRGQGFNAVGDVEPFGFFNYVIGQSRDRIRQVLLGGPDENLRRNRDLIVESRSDMLAFYVQDEQPKDLESFLLRSSAIASSIAQRADAQ
ncbi:MAG TPA: hypothetical protein VGJ84_15995, partial [Polyangiaceae bacterium]